jgi:deoxyribonuclease-4
MSIAGGFDLAIERGTSIGCEAIQIFLKNATQWRCRNIDGTEAKRFRDLRKCSGNVPVFAHSSYLINLGVENPRAVEALADEIRRANALGVPFIVLHPGSHLGAGEDAGLRCVSQNLDAVFAATPNSRVRIALETTAGQGSCLGHRFEHLAAILQSSKHPRRLAVCVDTCHLFAAGYDIRAPRSYETVMREFDAIIGSKHVVAFHLNDSKKELGSRVDRHEQIGKGFVGVEAFRCVLRDERWRGLPMVLETPKSEDMREDVVNLGILRGLL